MEDDRPANVLSKMSLQDQKVLYSVPSVDETRRYLPMVIPSARMVGLHLMCEQGTSPGSATQWPCATASVGR
jgi:hypothetical protein